MVLMESQSSLGKKEPCKDRKVLHWSEESADGQAQSLGRTKESQPNVYLCKECTAYFGADIWHVGYGWDSDRLSKRERRRRKEKKARRK